jgi:hypothetical protein
MDQLIWSVQPKDSAEERRKLAATVPAIVQGVTAGMKALADTSGLDFTAPVTVKNPYGAGEVEVSGVEMGAGSGAKTAVGADTLEKGMWVEFRPQGGAHKPHAAKVLFVTPKKTRFVFSDRNGGNMEELTRAELVRRLKTGALVRLDEEPEAPLFERIMAGLVGKLKNKPAAQPALA